MISRHVVVMGCFGAAALIPLWLIVRAELLKRSLARMARESQLRIAESTARLAEARRLAERGEVICERPGCEPAVGAAGRPGAQSLEVSSPIGGGAKSHTGEESELGDAALPGVQSSEEGGSL